MKPKVEAVRIPDGPTVYVRMLSGADRSKLVRLSEDAKRNGTEGDLNTHLVIMACCHEDGSPAYTSADFDRLNAIPAPVLDLIATEAARLNAVLSTSLDDAKKN